MNNKLFYKWLLFARFVFGDRCVLCRARTGGHGDCCPGCWDDLPFVGQACRCCAIPLPADVTTRVCGECQRRPRFDHAVAAFDYQEPVRWLITSLKFRGRRELARLLAAGLADRIMQSGEPAAEILIPVPLHAAGYRRRGFNQAELLARFVAPRIGGELDTRLMARPSDAPAQSTLSAAHRQSNIRGAFICRRRLDGRHVAIVDDVVTTGATATEMARTLRRAGAASVAVYCAARATA